MMFQDDEVEIQDRVGALDTTVDDTVDHGLPPECAKMLRDIVLRILTHSVGRCWAARLRAWSLLSCGFSQVQGPCERSPVRLLSCSSRAMRTAGETCCRVGLRGRGGRSACTRASSTRRFFSLWATSFRRNEVVRGVQAAAAEGGPTLDTEGGLAGFLRAVPGGAPWPPRDLGAGRGRLSEEATAGVCPPGGGRTPRGRCNDGSA